MDGTFKLRVKKEPMITWGQGRGETPEERAELHKAKAALPVGLHPNTRYVTCPIHGARGHIVDVVNGNLWIFEPEGDGLRCDPSHPGCFDWFDRTAGGGP